ncbi:MAG: glycosyltransferase family 4 protein [Verrucomicrobiae bacterium]|nr:glycosyltransferase family 4 protein [Verrucomicrobiae bacterium]
MFEVTRSEPLGHGLDTTRGPGEGGESRRLLMVGNFLSGHGLARGVGEELADRLRVVGWPVVTTSDRLNRWARWFQMMRVVRQHAGWAEVAHLDVFSGAAFLWAETAAAWLKRRGVPFVATLHGGNLPRFAARWPRRVKRVLSAARVVTAPSRYLADHMAGSRRDIRILPNPLEISRYPWRSRERPQPILVWLRALHRIYRPQLAAEVVARLKRELPGIGLTLYGPDKGDGARQDWEAAVAAFDVGREVSWAGGVPKADVPRALSGGDIFLNTTDVDNTPVSVIEAMACGLCVVSTNVGGTPYLIEEGHDGLLVPPGDAGAIAAAVLRLFREPGLAGRLSVHARRKVEAYDWGAVLPQWMRLLREVADGGSASMSHGSMKENDSHGGTKTRR